MVGLGGLEPPTSRLSSARSNQLSYKPELWRSNARSQGGSERKATNLGSSFGEEREAKTAASRQCGLTGRLNLRCSVRRPEANFHASNREQSLERR